MLQVGEQGKPRDLSQVASMHQNVVVFHAVDLRAIFEEPIVAEAGLSLPFVLPCLHGKGKNMGPAAR